jgi:predicted transposase YbfD/YdcC
MNILGNVKADSLNQLFMSWCATLVDGTANQIVAIDGKTIRSTGNIQACQRPLHIVSAYVSTCGLTIGQLAVDEKSNEIPAVQALIKLLDVKGTLVVADALNCQKNTAREVLVGGGDYLLAVKENQRDLHDDVKLFMTSERETMEHFEKSEKGHGRIETRKAWVSHDVSWYEKLNEWEGLCCLGAVRRICRERDKTSDETRFYISSRKLTAEELLQASRSEWGVESMHWMLDVIFGEDRTMLMEDNAQRTLNILRKTALNLVHLYKTVTNSKQSYVGVMRNNLFNPKLEPVDIK